MRAIDNQSSVPKNVLKKVLYVLGAEMVVVFMGLSIFILSHQSQNTALLDPTSNAQAVLGAEDENITPTEAPIILEPSPTPTSVPVLRKKVYKIALVGDTMIESMGPVLEYLQYSLKNTYKDNQFLAYNYGLTGQDAKQALEHFDERFTHDLRDYPPLAELKPDVIIVSTFAYTPNTPYNRDTEWLALSALLQKAEKVTSKVYVLAEIAPLKKEFGKGAIGVNWDDKTTQEYTTHVTELMQNAAGLANNLKVPFINAYNESLTSDKRDADKRFISPSDNIHPSKEGQELMADLMVKTVKFD